MNMITLCSFCVKAHPGFANGPCHICRNQLEQLDEWIGKGIALLEERKGFCLSTQMPKEWIRKEEEVWDVSLRGETVKQTANRYIVDALQRKGKRYATEAPVRLQMDFFHGVVQVVNEPLFFFGRYRKRQAQLSQTRWICSNCQGKGCGECKSKGKFYESVEEIIGEPFKEAGKAENYYLHASGREDVDATNTAGRPFVLQVVNAENAQFDLEALQRKIGSTGKVGVTHLRPVKRGWVALVGDSHFDKEYEVDVKLENAVEESELRKMERATPITLHQQTPRRVAHRRADLVRDRKVLRVQIVKAEGQHVTLRIEAEAGTYIKEFVSGDEGRTKPSMAEMLGTAARCERLEVTKIYDGFLDLCKPL